MKAQEIEVGREYLVARYKEFRRARVTRGPIKTASGQNSFEIEALDPETGELPSEPYRTAYTPRDFRGPWNPEGYHEKRLVENLQRKRVLEEIAAPIVAVIQGYGIKAHLKIDPRRYTPLFRDTGMVTIEVGSKDIFEAICRMPGALNRFSDEALEAIDKYVAAKGEA